MNENFITEIYNEYRERCINIVLPAEDLAENITSHTISADTFLTLYKKVKLLFDDKNSEFIEVLTHYRLDDENYIVYDTGQTECFLLTAQKELRTEGWNFQRLFYVPISSTRFRPIDKYHDISQYTNIRFSNSDVTYVFEILHKDVLPKERRSADTSSEVTDLVVRDDVLSLSFKVFVHQKQKLPNWLHWL